ncbi:MAG TPA: hypothetical protein VLI92_02805 [Candidatus Saccharimonadales bacterium]|nr:hypothetical protein [Candidatus Saccharimonadales bacterium]
MKTFNESFSRIGEHLRIIQKAIRAMGASDTLNSAKYLKFDTTIDTFLAAVSASNLSDASKDREKFGWLEDVLSRLLKFIGPVIEKATPEMNPTDQAIVIKKLADAHDRKALNVVGRLGTLREAIRILRNFQEEQQLAQETPEVADFFKAMRDLDAALTDAAPTKLQTALNTVKTTAPTPVADNKPVPATPAPTDPPKPTLRGSLVPKATRPAPVATATTPPVRSNGTGTKAK